MLISRSTIGESVYPETDLPVSLHIKLVLKYIYHIIYYIYIYSVPYPHKSYQCAYFVYFVFTGGNANENGRVRFAEIATQTVNLTNLLTNLNGSLTNCNNIGSPYFDNNSMPTPTGTQSTTNLNNKITMPSTAAYGDITHTIAATEIAATTPYTPANTTTNTSSSNIIACAIGVGIETNANDGNDGEESQVLYNSAVTALTANTDDDDTASATVMSNTLANALHSNNTTSFAPEANVTLAGVVCDGAAISDITPTTAAISSIGGSLPSSAIRQIRPQQVEDITNVRTTATTTAPTAVTETAQTVTSTTMTSTTSNVDDALNGTATMNDTSL